MLAAVSQQNKLLLGGIAAIVIVFSLVSALAIPRRRPEFPGRGLRAFLLVTVLAFVAMMLAVEFFAVEEEEEAHAGGAPQTRVETGEHASEAGSETMPAVTSPGRVSERVEVVGTEFALELSKREFRPGNYEFVLVNEGDAPHNLVISGPEVEKAATPVIGAGKRATIRVALVDGDYELYCSVPGHEEAGMRTKITVG